MAENPKKSGSSLELKIQIPRHWREVLDLIAEKGFEHRSANDVALSFIAAGIKATLEDTLQTHRAIKELGGQAVVGRQPEVTGTDEQE